MSDSDNSIDGEEAANYAVYCTLCKMGFNSTTSYSCHMKGEKHAKAEKKEFMKKKYNKNYADALSKMKSKKGSTSNESDSKEGAEDDDAEVYTCNLCNKICTGIVNYKTHLDGKHHAKKMKKEKLMAQLKSEFSGSNNTNGASVTPIDKDHEALYVTCPQLKPFAYCEECSKSFSGPETYKQHLDSEIHKKMVQKLALVENMGENHKLVKRSISNGSDDPTPFAICKECDKTFHDPIPYHQHMLSESHKKRLKKLQMMEKVKHLVVADDEQVGVFRCGECNKYFNDPKAFYQHLSGSAHTKQKEKDDLLHDLVQRFPELLTDTKKNAKQKGSDRDSDSDDGTFLACSICHKSFSGPENARDHLRSQKHLKTVKEKKRIKKIIEKQKANHKNGKIDKTSTHIATSTEPSASSRISTNSSDEFEVVG